MPSFVEIDGRRFELVRARLELYHCASGEADWNLALVRMEAGVEQTMWLSGTVCASLERTADLHGCALQIEGRDLDELFGALIGVQITSYPGGQDVCRAALDASVSGDEVELHSAFEFDWDRSLDPPDAHYVEPRTARLQLTARVLGLHPGSLPEPA